MVVANIHGRIFEIRGNRVMLSPDLANLYGVEPRVLHQGVKRNSGRFPEDFMFQLTWKDLTVLKSQSVILKARSGSASRSQFVTLKRGGNIKYLPYAFTEQGVAMLSSVLRSKRAIQANICSAVLWLYKPGCRYPWKPRWIFPTPTIW